MIRTTVPPQSLVAGVREAIKSASPALEPTGFLPMEQLVSNSVAQPRFYTFLLCAFAALALLLAAIGIYGVLAYSVTQRTREIGVRLALGAGQGSVLRLVLKQGLALALIGSVIGLIGALAMTRLMSAMLFEVRVTDPLTYGTVSVLLILVVLMACWIPARRATKVDPIIALRCE